MAYEHQAQGVKRACEAKVNKETLMLMEPSSGAGSQKGDTLLGVCRPWRPSWGFFWTFSSKNLELTSIFSEGVSSLWPWGRMRTLCTEDQGLRSLRAVNPLTYLNLCSGTLVRAQTQVLAWWKQALGAGWNVPGQVSARCHAAELQQVSKCFLSDLYFKQGDAICGGRERISMPLPGT